jgi:hypothetical protein
MEIPEGYEFSVWVKNEAALELTCWAEIQAAEHNEAGFRLGTVGNPNLVFIGQPAGLIITTLGEPDVSFFFPWSSIHHTKMWEAGNND